MSFAAALFLCLSPVAVDGDTLRCGGGVGLVRLLSIDAPELAGHCRTGRVCTPGDGPAARAALAAMIAGQQVACQPEGRDRYGRVLARCAVQGRDLSCAMVRSGFAVQRYGVLGCRW